MLIDNKRGDDRWKQVKPTNGLTSIWGATKPIELEEDDRQMGKVSGPWHNIRIEILENEKVVKTYERRFTVGLANSFILSIQKMVAEKDDWLTPR